MNRVQMVAVVPLLSTTGVIGQVANPTGPHTVSQVVDFWVTNTEQLIVPVVLRRIKIKNFKSLQDTGELRLGKRNIFIGPNGSGKTNTIDAIKFLTNISIHGVSRAIGDRNGFFDVFWKGASETKRHQPRRKFFDARFERKDD